MFYMKQKNHINLPPKSFTLNIKDLNSVVHMFSDDMSPDLDDISGRVQDLIWINVHTVVRNLSNNVRTNLGVNSWE